MKKILQHEDGKNYKADTVTVQYDGKLVDLDVDGDGTVQAGNVAEAEALKQHPKFFPINEAETVEQDSGTDTYVLEERSVDEVKEYLSSITSVERLKELRELESNGRDRKTALQAIDNRIKNVEQHE